MSGFDEKLSGITTQSFGPNGTKKILIKHHEKLYLNELAIEKPPIKCLVLAGEEQQNNFGDGVNLVVLIARQLLQGAKELIMQGIDSTQIIQCYKEATNKVLEILETLVEGGSGSETMDVMNEDEVVLRMKAPVATKEYQMRDILCQLIAKACIKVCPKEREDFNVDNVRIFKLLGADLQDSKIFKGMALNINTVVGTVKEKKNAKVLVIDGGADTTDSEQWVKEVAELDVQVMVSGASLGERAICCCNLYEIMVLMIDSPIEFDCFCRTTHATLSKLGSTVNPDHLGHVDSIKVKKAARCPRVTVKSEQGDVATLLLGAHNEIVADNYERAAVNGVNTYKALCTDSRIVPGAGATEIEIARSLKKFAKALCTDGRIVPGAGATEIEIASSLQKFADIETRSSYQEALLNYAQSFELIPVTLAKNAFLNVDWIIKSLCVLHDQGNVKACIDVRKGGCNDASMLKIWDLYITKYEAIKNATEAVYKALSFYQDERLLIQAEFYRTFIARRMERLKEKIILLESVLPCNKEWLEVEEHGEKVYGLSTHGTLHCCDKKMKESWATEIGRELNLLDSSSIVSSTVTKQDPLFLDKEIFKHVFRWNETDDCVFSTVMHDMYINPMTGEVLATPDFCSTNEVLLVNHTKIQLTVYKKRINIPKQGTKLSMEDFSHFFRHSEYVIKPLTLDGAKWRETFRKHMIPDSIAYRLPPGVLYENIEWVGRVLGKQGELMINLNHSTATNLLCITKGRSNDADIKMQAGLLDEICRKNSNVLKVYRVIPVNDVYYFLMEKFGKPLCRFIQDNSSVIKDDDKLINLVGGILNGVLALHGKEIAVGNLEINDFFVDEFLNVKIAPFNTQRKFTVSSQGRGRKSQGITNSSAGNISFYSSQSAVNDMNIVGKALFYCFTGREYKNESFISPKSPQPYMMRLWEFPGAWDLLKQIIDDKVTAVEARNHTIFWPWIKNVEFIRSIQERGSLSNKINNLNSGNSVFVGSWRSKFPAEFIQVMIAGSYQTDKTKPVFNTDQLFDLLKICRHLITHEIGIRQVLQKLIANKNNQNQPVDPRVYEMFGNPVHSLLKGSGDKKRFEKYFRQRFPNLIPVIHNGMRQDLENHPNFKDYYDAYTS